MDTISIFNYINPHQRKKNFKRVFACDAMPRRFSLPAAFVINLSKHNEPGSHWVAVYISESGHAFYFDSFGIEPKNVYVKSFLRMHAKRMTYNKKQIQHISSNKCGLFCCVFVVITLKKCSIDTFVRRFSINLLINDFILENMYRYFKVK